MKIIIAILVFSFVVCFHELGHFLMSRLCGVYVEEFSLGMGPRLLSHVSRRSGTRYSLKALPFGGSCALKGEFDEEKSEGSFNGAKIWQRMLIIAGGPVFNFILAMLGAALIMAGAGIDFPYIEYVWEESPAQQAGMEAGDKFISMDGHRIMIFRDFVAFMETHEKEFRNGEPVNIVWMHDGEKKSADVVMQNDGYGNYKLGVSGGGRFKASPLQVIGYSVYEMGFWIRTTLSSLKLLVTGKVSVENVSGPVGVVKIIGDTYEEVKEEGLFMVFLNMVNMLVLISANLGVMNLLPFPALDGGRLAMLVLESVRRKKISASVENYINMAGLAVLMVLMVLILVHDVQKIVVG